MFNRLTNTRRKDAHLIREEAAELAALRPHLDHINNGDEERFRRDDGKLSYIGNFSKGLNHNFIGEVLPDSYRTLLRAMFSTDPTRFERSSMMGTLNGLNLLILKPAWPSTSRDRTLRPSPYHRRRAWTARKSRARWLSCTGCPY